MWDERFLGKWKSVSMENFDEYMKALGKSIHVMNLIIGKLL